jgi:hypothetical protein
MKKGVVVLFLLLGGVAFGQGSLGEIIGSVVDQEKKEEIVDARVWVEQDGKKYQAKTDIEGRFRISAVPAGSYFVNVYYEMDTMRNIPVQVVADGFGNTGIIQFAITKSDELGPVTVSAEYTKMQLALTATPVFTMTTKDITKSPAKFSVTGMITGMTSDVKINDDGELMFRGSRAGDMLYLVDGIKTRSIGSLPSCAINSMMIYTGGLPAKYGDTMGGVIVLETKSYFDMYRERNAN